MCIRDSIRGNLGQSFVALPVRSFGIFVTDVLCRGWQAISGHRGGQRTVYICIAVMKGTNAT